MAAHIAGIVSKKLLKESAENRFGQDDPYFESVPATNLLGRPTTEKKRKAAPEGISTHDAKVLTKVKRRAYRLDLSLCNFCGIRFGWSSVIGLVPAIGDALDMFMALMVVASCNKIEGGLPAGVRMRMLLNVALDFVVGLIPFIGDIADAMYKCNTRNAVLLEQFLKKRGDENLQRSGLRLHERRTDPSPERQLNTRGSGRQTTPPRDYSPARPQPARIQPERPSRDPARVYADKSSGNPISSPGRIREPDLEMGRM
ncbi:hypothetical protein PAAG_02505 [Paracoccidioides lutzii Pb01]|uniref:PH domain-containing protein n=1 Tax=Paracoccidioides lutzii (strain ATCC MYA-826 / Pb01) TaxID=502779 RepID=C1GV32_PARBA|nr:hypothetical protein PAAG_02505 [Paracoccidioides lutzii Pb01]EEH40450.2 hypothetical protein PAAG_02505 [Paracoccidioides lutzii Pb01]